MIIALRKTNCGICREDFRAELHLKSALNKMDIFTGLVACIWMKAAHKKAGLTDTCEQGQIFLRDHPN